MSTDLMQVLVTRLGQEDKVSFAAHIDDVSTRTMQVRTPCPVEWGCLLKLQHGDTIWIGEACYSRHDDINSNEFRTWVKLVETESGEESHSFCTAA
jgi:hypothetical protein